jgi:4-amino-4-deoxy-L-arabinose transferase-like glycosyltransferase
MLDHIGLWSALLAGLLLKTALLLTHSVTFNGDEAVMALMGRHILQGEFPVFFYGQSYMGALDAYLIAGNFALIGQSVLAVHVVQIILHGMTVAITYWLGLRLSGNRFAAGTAAWLMAIPPVLISLYTTVTLGDYGEILILNGLIFLAGWRVLTEQDHPAWLWFAIGLMGGLGWWSMALIVISLAPILLIGAWKFKTAPPVKRMALMGAGFLIGALPWLAATVQRGADATLLDMAGAWFSKSDGGGTGNGLLLHILTLLLFNLPALIGLRPPWSVEWIALPVGIMIIGIVLIVLWSAIKQTREETAGRIERLSLLGGGGLLIALFVLSPFGGDPTGRYFLPLAPILAVLIGEWAGRLRAQKQTVRWMRPAAVSLATVAIFLAYNLWGNARSMLQNPPGLTTQFDPISHLPQEYDGDLIAFLDSIGANRGYSNTWITFRFAFLTGERIIFSPRLPYKLDMSYTYGDDRYPPYSKLVDAAKQVVYVTSNHPLLDQKIRQRFADLKVRYREKQIGPYTVFYDLSWPVRPDDLGAFGEVSGAAIHGD